MPTALRRAIVLALLNVALALAMQWAAPSTPRHTDRREYEDVGRQPLSRDCPWSIYCYRVLVPVLIEQLPVESEVGWRWHQAAAVATAGTLSSWLAVDRMGMMRAGVFAAVAVQSSYGFAFTAYDPFTVDPFVFVCLAAIALCWWRDRWRAALVIALVGLLAKETVAFIAAAWMLASVAWRHSPIARQWLLAGVVVWAALIGYRATLDVWLGWSIADNPAANLAGGSWLALWWINNPSIWRKLYLLFAPFGTMWAGAFVDAYRHDDRLRSLAAGAILPFLALCYVQTPERALGNLFFVVVPLAAGLLARAPWPLALAAVVTNGLVTAKLGTSSAWLPPSSWLLGPAVVSAVVAMWWARSIDPPATRR